MNIQTLQQIYPEAIKQAHATKNPNYFVFEEGHDFLWVPVHNLSNTERQLLQTFFKPKKIGQNIENHVWYEAVFQHQNAPVTAGRFRMIQVEFSSLDEATANDWNDELTNIFPQLVDHFFVSDTYGLIIEAYHEDSLTTEDLAGVFLALDGDFNTYTRLFVGSFFPYTEDFTRILAEERQLFDHELQRSNHEKCHNLSSTSLNYFAEESVKNSYLMRMLYQDWFKSEEDLVEIIQALWNNQGNISSTAKDLFMHRNTLQYKLDKFQQQTQCNLKNMNDLFLAYLLISTFKN